MGCHENPLGLMTCLEASMEVPWSPKKRRGGIAFKVEGPWNSHGSPVEVPYDNPWRTTWSDTNCHREASQHVDEKVQAIRNCMGFSLFHKTQNQQKVPQVNCITIIHNLVYKVQRYRQRYGSVRYHPSTTRSREYSQSVIITVNL